MPSARSRRMRASWQQTTGNRQSTLEWLTMSNFMLNPKPESFRLVSVRYITSQGLDQVQVERHWRCQDAISRLELAATRSGQRKIPVTLISENGCRCASHQTSANRRQIVSIGSLEVELLSVLYLSLSLSLFY